MMEVRVTGSRVACVLAASALLATAACATAELSDIANMPPWAEKAPGPEDYLRACEGEGAGVG